MSYHHAICCFNNLFFAILQILLEMFVVIYKFTDQRIFDIWRCIFTARSSSIHEALVQDIMLTAKETWIFQFFLNKSQCNWMTIKFLIPTFIFVLSAVTIFMLLYKLYSPRTGILVWNYNANFHLVDRIFLKEVMFFHSSQKGSNRY